MNSNIDITSLFLQALSLQILFQDYNNRDIMAELQMQDENYFKKVLSNQEKIIKLLEERSDTRWMKE